MSMDQMTPDYIGSQCERSINWSRSRFDLWRSFCQRYRVGENSVPLFESDENGFDKCSTERRSTTSHFKRGRLQTQLSFNTRIRRRTRRARLERKSSAAVVEEMFWMRRALAIPRDAPPLEKLFIGQLVRHQKSPRFLKSSFVVFMKIRIT